MSIPIHRFIDPVDRSRSISTVDKDSLTGEYGRYRRSIRIHLQRITVDRGWWIKIRHNFVVDLIDDTCAKCCQTADKSRPAEVPFQNWYTVNTNHFMMTDFCHFEIKTTTGFSNKHCTAYSCAEDQILEN